MNQTTTDITLDNLKKRILCHIGGYVVAKLLPTIKCNFCAPALEDLVHDPLGPDIARLIN